jgi:hypothetical protein
MKTSSNNKIPIVILNHSPIENKDNNKTNFNSNKRNSDYLLYITEKSKTHSNSPRERNDSLGRGISPKISKNGNEKDNKSSSNKSLFSGARNLSPLLFKNTNVNIFKDNFKKPKKFSTFKTRKDSYGILIEKINKNHHIFFNNELLVDIIDVESYKDLNKIDTNYNSNDYNDSDDNNDKDKDDL